MSLFQLVPLPYFPDSQSYFRRLHGLAGAVWLDSGHNVQLPGHTHDSRSRLSPGVRYDILTALPREQLSATEEGCRVDYENGSFEEIRQPPLTYLEKRLHDLGLNDAPSSPETDLPFTGGAIGYISYEALHREFGLTTPTGPPDIPETWFGIYDWALIQDHLLGKTQLLICSSCPPDKGHAIQERLKGELPPLPPFQCGPLQADISQDDYLTAIARVQEYILAGDCYQINYTQRFAGPFRGSSAAAYLALRQKLTGPFSAYLAIPGGSLMSLSPERFIEQVGVHLRTQPIKGTAPRGRSAEEDEAQASRLQSSEKNRAENVMIVDLLRNDFSKICEPFSVKVPELFSLQSFANVHHLVSTVEGRLMDGASPFDVIRACFPGGSITGAPKKRAMEIIAELEGFKRGVYCGSVVYISFNGRMDSNIAIRTLVQSQEQIYCWGGGGIVADSDPLSEYQESLHKIGVLLETLNSASGH